MVKSRKTLIGLQTVQRTIRSRLRGQSMILKPIPRFLGAWRRSLQKLKWRGSRKRPNLEISDRR